MFLFCFLFKKQVGTYPPDSQGMSARKSTPGTCCHAEIAYILWLPINYIPAFTNILHNLIKIRRLSANCSLLIKQYVDWHSEAASFDQVTVLILASHIQLIFASLDQAHKKLLSEKKKSPLLWNRFSVIKRIKSCQELLPHLYVSHVCQELIYSLYGSDFTSQKVKYTRLHMVVLACPHWATNVRYPLVSFDNFLDDFVSSSAICITGPSFWLKFWSLFQRYIKN